MARSIASIELDMSELDALIGYAAPYACRFGDEKRQAFQDGFEQTMRDEIDIAFQAPKKTGAIFVTASAKLLGVLTRFGIPLPETGLD